MRFFRQNDDAVSHDGRVDKNSCFAYFHDRQANKQNNCVYSPDDRRKYGQLLGFLHDLSGFSNR